MLDSRHAAFQFDRYRSLGWNMDVWFAYARDVDAANPGADVTGTLLRGLTVAYLDLLGDAYHRLAPTHDWKTPRDGGPSFAGEVVVYALANPTPERIQELAEAHAHKSLLITTLGVAQPEHVERCPDSAAICGIFRLLTGEAVKDTLMDGVVWRPCLTKLVQAYNFLADSNILGPAGSHRIENRD
ncbi:MAG: hypothetical protein P4L33_21095 [Capsulimonadaceae bacterium]|nr:hypothetical protein [Capsulimonadaceae bacterium]